MEAKSILDGLQKQRERGFLCDVKLEADGENVILFGFHILYPQKYESKHFHLVIGDFFYV